MQLHLEHDKPMIFGIDRDKGIRIKPGELTLEVVRIGENGIDETDVMVHDETNRALAAMLAVMEPPHGPVALGVLYCAPAPSYERLVNDQITAAELQSNDAGDLDALMRRGYTWTVD